MFLLSRMLRPCPGAGFWLACAVCSERAASLQSVSFGSLSGGDGPAAETLAVPLMQAMLRVSDRLQADWDFH
jgi:hypothetical protein